MKNKTFELNGVANIKLLLDLNVQVNNQTGLKEITLYGSEVDELYKQIALLTSYMQECNNALSNNTTIPQWHDIAKALRVRDHR